MTEYIELSFFADPRTWLREDVEKWVHYMMEIHSLPSIQTDRFLMNGKALCLMTIDMFCQRVPLGGKTLYKDFQLRLSQAMYSTWWAFVIRLYLNLIFTRVVISWPCESEILASKSYINYVLRKFQMHSTSQSINNSYRKTLKFLSVFALKYESNHLIKWSQD